MVNFAVFYIEAMIACILLSGILLAHNHFNIDRQEKQIKFDRVLIAFILYFGTDIFWAVMEGGLLPKTPAGVIIVTFAQYLFMAAIAYFWLEYAMAVEQVPHRNRPINRFAVVFPFLIVTAILVLNYALDPHMIIDGELNTQPIFGIYLMSTPIIYLMAVLFYTLRRARREENPLKRRKHLFLGFFPLVTLVVGAIQTISIPNLPIYCFTDVLLILVFYIQSIEARVSLDPLTTLNNRGQLQRYISQKNNLYQDDRLTMVIMMDINKFKMINDTYGHAEGDKALVIVADALKATLSTYNMPSFLGRYGGDEFILIIHPQEEKTAEKLVRDIREQISQAAAACEVPYRLTLGIGYDLLAETDDTVQNCMLRADKKLYEDKKRESAR